MLNSEVRKLVKMEWSCFVMIRVRYMLLWIKLGVELLKSPYKKHYYCDNIT